MIPRSVILGLDVSPRRIGWAVISWEEGTPLRAGVEHVSADDDLRARRVAFREAARTADGIGDVAVVAIEDAYVGISRRGTITHALSVGNVEAFAAARWPDCLVDRISPAAWRSAVGLPGKGKDPVKHWATAAIGQDLEQDAADALGVASAAHALIWNRKGGEPEATAYKTPSATPNGKEATR